MDAPQRLLTHSLHPRTTAPIPPPPRTPDDAAPIAAAAGTAGSECVTSAAGAVIGNGTIELGVNQHGPLNYGGVGLHHLPTDGDLLVPAYPGEVWDLADAASCASGSARPGSGGVNPTNRSFVATARSVVEVGNACRVTHDFHPSPLTADLYEVTVTVKNLQAAAAADLPYRRVLDWDVPPTEFSEYVTIAGSSPLLLFSSNNGFAPGDPRSGPSDLGHTGTFDTKGPQDHGALFDLLAV